jgi:hypothetical protein
MRKKVPNAGVVTNERPANVLRLSGLRGVLGTRDTLYLGDVVWINADHKWHDGLTHVVVKLTPEVCSVNFACTPRIAHLYSTLVKTIGQTPTCIQCTAVWR